MRYIYTALTPSLTHSNLHPPDMQQPLHPEILSIVELNSAHGRKPYYSGRLIRRVERQADGQRPANDEGWTDVWAQLNGITLSTWDMRQIEEARKQGTEAPPTYINVTDAVRIVSFYVAPITLTYHAVLVCTRRWNYKRTGDLHFPSPKIPQRTHS